MANKIKGLEDIILAIQYKLKNLTTYVSRACCGQNAGAGNYIPDCMGGHQKSHNTSQK